jgi:hypothetical protein
MNTSAQRHWTQATILEETRRLHSGPGFFNVLHDVCNRAFGGMLDTEPVGTEEWEFDIGEITVGQLIDFFGAVPLQWHNETGGPCAYVVVDDRELAAKFCLTFGIEWATEREMQDRRDEDFLRAAKLY